MRAGPQVILYLVAFAVSGLVCGGVYRFIDWSVDVLGCTLDRTPDAFLAACKSDQYGDYEHGAYYLDLEPQAVEAARRAKVLIFGNSRAQFAYSTDAVRRFFTDRSIPFYLLGFGYADGDRFAAALVAKYRLRPRFVIIDTNPFFTNFVSVPAKAMMPGGPSWWQLPLDRIPVWWDYLSKKAFNSLQPMVCRLHPTLCPGTFPTAYRSVLTGFWVVNNYVPSDWEGYPITEEKLIPFSGPPLTASVPNAERFLKLLEVPRECVVLTGAPSTALNASAYANGFAELLGLRAVLPQLEGLRTIDTSHLTANSAERWSAAVTSEIESFLTRCLSAPEQLPIE